MAVAFHLSAGQSTFLISHFHFTRTFLLFHDCRLTCVACVRFANSTWSVWWNLKTFLHGVVSSCIPVASYNISCIYTLLCIAENVLDCVITFDFCVFRCAFHVVANSMAFDFFGHSSDTQSSSSSRMTGICEQMCPELFCRQALWVFGLTWNVWDRHRRAYLWL